MRQIIPLMTDPIVVVGHTELRDRTVVEAYEQPFGLVVEVHTYGSGCRENL